MTNNGTRLVTLEFYSFLGRHFTLKVPSIRVVCPRCNGEGVHDHSAFSDGLTSDDLNDQDFRESYLSGNYDVECEECNGLRIVDEPNFEVIEKRWPTIFKAYMEDLEQQRIADAESAAERRWGA